MNRMLDQVPVPLQHQIILRVAAGILALVLGVVLLSFFSEMIAAPFLLIMAVLVADAVHIYWVAVHNSFLELGGTVLKVERTLWHRRPSAALLEVEGKALHITIHNRNKALQEGEQVRLFVADSTPLSQRRGLYHLDGYLALVVESEQRTNRL